MEKNDIGETVHRHVACRFEGLLMHKKEEPAPEKRSFFQRAPKPSMELTDDEYVSREVRLWRANEMPLKSIIHLTTKLGIAVEVYTYMDGIFVPHIEHWLSRKGANVTVWNYANLGDLWDDFKYNRDVHTYFTPDQDEAARLGMRATVVNPDGTFGF